MAETRLDFSVVVNRECLFKSLTVTATTYVGGNKISEQLMTTFTEMAAHPYPETVVKNMAMRAVMRIVDTVLDSEIKKEQR